MSGRQERVHYQVHSGWVANHTWMEGTHLSLFEVVEPNRRSLPTITTSADVKEDVIAHRQSGLSICPNNVDAAEWWVMTIGQYRISGPPLVPGRGFC